MFLFRTRILTSELIPEEARINLTNAFGRKPTNIDLYDCAQLTVCQ